MDDEFKQCRALRRKLERKWRNSKSDDDRRRYVDQRNTCTELSVSKQKAYYAGLIENSPKSQGSLFKIVDKLLGKESERILPSHTDPLVLANEFNDFYVEKVKTIRESIPPTNEQAINIQTFEGEVLSYFAPTNEEEVRNIIKECGIKTSSEDPIPAKLLKSVIDDIVPFFVRLVNKSFSEGTMDGIKQSVIDPLLKKAGLDCDDKKNYRPVSNLAFLSKLIERVVLKRLDHHMNVNKLHNDNQFGYKKYHSTETMILGIVNDILNGFDAGKATITVFLDLSAAFDTIDIEKMLLVLSNDLGVQGLALDWCKSFLVGRKQRVQINGCFSDSLTVEYGVPQGSSLGPKFFNAYVRSQPEVFHSCDFKTSSFADDANGSKTFALTFQYNVLTNDVPNCVDKIVQWMNKHFLKINPDKTEIVLFHPESQQNDVIIRGTMIEGQCIRFSNETKNVGVWLDENLNLDSHINRTVSHCYKGVFTWTS